MTAAQKKIVSYLLSKRYYLVETKNFNGVRMYKLYKDNQVPVRYVHYKTIDAFTRLFKRSKKGKITLNLNLVRQEHGNSFINQQYKKSRHYGNGSN